MAYARVTATVEITRPLRVDVTLTGEEARLLMRVLRSFNEHSLQELADQNTRPCLKGIGVPMSTKVHSDLIASRAERLGEAWAKYETPEGAQLADIGAALVHALESVD